MATDNGFGETKQSLDFSSIRGNFQNERAAYVDPLQSSQNRLMKNSGVFVGPSNGMHASMARNASTGPRMAFNFEPVQNQRAFSPFWSSWSLFWFRRNERRN